MNSLHFLKRCVIWGVSAIAIFTSVAAQADDTCVFGLADASVAQPNVMILLDNGAEMVQTVWSAGYERSKDYTPAVGVEKDVDADTPNGFFNLYGYGMTVDQDGNVFLVKVLEDMRLENTENGFPSSGVAGTGIFDINGKSITLPVKGSETPDGDPAVADNAGYFRYSANYLNWIFFSGEYDGDGTDLPDKSRLYYAKQGIAQFIQENEKAGYAIFAFRDNAKVGQPIFGFENDATAGLTEAVSTALDGVTGVIYSPLAEGLGSIGSFLNTDSTLKDTFYCAPNVTVIITPGIPSKDDGLGDGFIPNTINSDYDNDTNDGTGKLTVGGETIDIPVGYEGATYLDDVAAYQYDNAFADRKNGTANAFTYTIGLMSGADSTTYLINVSNNGNGETNLTDPTDPEYGRYHTAVSNEDADQDQATDLISSGIMRAMAQTSSKTNTFAAPVVPVARTTSGNIAYLSFFQALPGNFWEGNLTKYKLSGDLEILDKNDRVATESNGAIKETAAPYWQTKDWATPGAANYMYNGDRRIYTVVGGTMVSFDATNTDLTQTLIDGGGAADEADAVKVINYVRGADVNDEDADGETDDNRAVITGDIFHSEPVSVRYPGDVIRVLYGANDGMLHAVKDSPVANQNSTDGKEAWAFVPPDVLPNLKSLMGYDGHPYFVDSSPRVYHDDANFNNYIDSGETAILVCGLRKGGAEYFALNIQSPDNPELLWIVNRTDYPDLGETWSEPVFGKVMVGDAETEALFVGGGYDPDNAKGNFVLVLNVRTGELIKKFTHGDMDYSIPSTVRIVDVDGDKLIDKAYVGDLGGQMWRFGKFTDGSGVPLIFPDRDQNVNNWESVVLVSVASLRFPRMFYYPPTISLEKGYDAVFMGTGNREDACATFSSDYIIAVKDNQSDAYPKVRSDLIRIGFGDADLDNPNTAGWWMPLAVSEKVLSEGVVFNKVFFVTTFASLYEDRCKPAGVGKLWGLDYKSGLAAIDLDQSADGSKEENIEIRGGIPSRPVIVLTDNKAKLLVSVGTTKDGVDSRTTAAGIVSLDPGMPAINYYEIWWRETF